ncbi:MAG: quinoprotein dehydrogenase-associated SoxYZ-like carrier [Leptothrix sp. (in: b-proteobacteria)]
MWTGARASRSAGLWSLIWLALCLPQMVRAQAPAIGDPEASPRWQAVRASLFGQRAIGRADEVITLQAPSRAIDASAVPIVLSARFAQSPARHIDKVWLIIDANPSPIAAIFSYTLASGRADIETRVRIDEYSYVRAVAELGDGSLVMAVKHVKASGGCSAAPGKDAEAAQASLGRMAWRIDGEARIGQPVLAQLSISHPNDTGMVMDQVARTYTPAHYVRRIAVTYAGQPVLDADVDFAISENPNLRLWFVPQGPGELSAEASDTQQRHFETRLALQPAP